MFFLICSARLSVHRDHLKAAPRHTFQPEGVHRLNAACPGCRTPHVGVPLVSQVVCHVGENRGSLQNNGMMTFTGSMIACAKLHGVIPSKHRIVPFRWGVTAIIFVTMALFGTLAFCGGDRGWNDREVGIWFILVVAILASIYGIIGVMAIGGGDMPVSISFLNSLSGFSTSAAGFLCYRIRRW